MKKFSLFFAISMLAVSAHAVVGYSDVTTFSGVGYAQNGAALDGVTSTSASTTLVADDITFAPGMAGGSVTGFTFSVANFNSAAVSANADVRLYASNGTSGGPGTLLSALNFNPISFTSGSVATFTFTSATSLFTVPTNGTIWAGISFSNDSSTSTATTTQLNSIGQGLFNPPTIGSSTDVFFQSTLGGSQFLTSNPTGSFLYFGGNPVANFGWQFNVTPLPTPEPSAFAALGLGAVAVLRRRKRA